MTNARRHPSPRTRAGLTLVEAVMSLLVLAVLATAALSAVAQARRSRAAVDEQSMGDALARSLLSEITSKPYMEPSSAVIAVDAGEDPGDRRTFDDVDDYNAYKDGAPCLGLDGKDIPGTDHWQRSVTVSWVTVSDTTTPVNAESSVKRIWVVVTHNNKTVVRLSALRGKAWDDMLATGGL